MRSRKSEKAVSLAAVLDLNEAAALRGKLMGLRGSNVVIDASGVERIGALCVQVIMAAAKTWNEDKLSFTFTKVPRKRTFRGAIHAALTTSRPKPASPLSRSPSKITRVSSRFAPIASRTASPLAPSVVASSSAT